MASQSVTPDYVPATIEERWQRAWQEAEAFKTPTSGDRERAAYIFSACPFTSGSAHMGHIRSYSISDAYARYLRMSGRQVLFSIGFDAFGLPSEIGAIKNELTPQQWVEQCRERMRGQFDRLGYSFDWEREWVTSYPELYKWTQWLFLLLLRRGLIYHAEGQVDWCDNCRTVLASLQVEDGTCWRCHEPVRLVQRSQWYLGISEYLLQNERGIELLDGWNQAAVAAQRTMLGRVDGVELDASTMEGIPLTVFTPHRDAVDRGEFVMISPSHPEIDAWAADHEVRAQLERVQRVGVQRDERSAEAAPLIETGRALVVPGFDNPLPVVITPAVDDRFGHTAILGIPAADRVDARLAKRVRAAAALGWKLPSGRPKLRDAARYRARDFPVSRQRAWGAPIPLVHCGACGTVPVPEEQLPVRLPDDLRPTGEGNALAAREDFIACTCPRCGAAARRETDTLDCHVDGLWQWLPFSVPAAEREGSMFTSEELRRWLPVHIVIWGADGGGSMFDQRMTAKVLRDADVLPHLADGEPHQRVLMHEMVHLDGRKMSKHLGNVVDPDALLERVGADTVRLAVLYAAAPTNILTWTDQALQYCHRWLHNFWQYALPRLEGAGEVGAPDPEEGAAKLRKRLDNWHEVAVRRITENMEGLETHRAARNVMTLVERIRDYERRVLRAQDSLTPSDQRALQRALLDAVVMLAPLAPHIAEELWSAAGQEGLVCSALWPEVAARSARD
ncbi:MAG TPA: class I tRNA ligase family protein [Polyangiales bacterium]|nr:class I tRNA ligase family protein [Polyangiales bacterium]